MSQETFPASRQELDADFNDLRESVLTAHGHCRTAERRVRDFLNAGPPPRPAPELKSSLVSIRVLGHLLECNKLYEAQDQAATDVSRALEDVVVTDEILVEKMVRLGEFYLEYFLRIFRDIDRGQTPTPSRPSRQSFNFNLGREAAREFLNESPISYEDTQEKALIRDGYRDIITRTMDETYYVKSWLREHPSQAPPEGVSATQCRHIFTKSFNADNSQKAKGKAAGSSWNVLSSFGYGSLLHELNGPGVHRLPNVLTLSLKNHKRFESMRLWLEETDVRHRYRVITPEMPATLRDQEHIQEFVDFRAQGEATENMLPSPDYLRLHACACKISHLAGASGYFKALEDFYDDHGDGTIDTHFEVLRMQLQSLEPRMWNEEDSVDSEGDV